jgi:hypothetical protein
MDDEQASATRRKGGIALAPDTKKRPSLHRRKLVILTLNAAVPTSTLR